MLKRHAIQVLREAGHSQADVRKRLGVSEPAVRMIEAESPVVTIDEDLGLVARGGIRGLLVEYFRPSSNGRAGVP